MEDTWKAQLNSKNLSNFDHKMYVKYDFILNMKIKY